MESALEQTVEQQRTLLSHHGAHFHRRQNVDRALVSPANTGVTGHCGRNSNRLRRRIIHRHPSQQALKVTL